MRRTPIALTFSAIAFMAALAARQSQAPANATTLFEGARLIAGDDRPPIADSAFLVPGDRIVAAGRRGEVSAPAAASRVDLAGKTVMPALINVHVHIGYEGFTSWGADRYTAQNVLDHLQR